MGKQLSSLTGELNKEATQLLIKGLLQIIADKENVSLDGIIEKNTLKILSRLNYDSSGQLRVVIPAVSGNLTTVTNVTNGGLGSMGLKNTTILISQQNYYNSFRRNIS